MTSVSLADQSITIDPAAGGKRFDGIGAVSGGGATSVLLKDYTEPQRSQILDLLFKPKFGASISALYVEVGGDGNSTQGSELSHMHTRGEENDYRGYEWWLMREAKKRNPAITLDACAWSCPGWVGNGDFYSQDMCDYYVKWIKALKTTHGLDLDAIGIRNERGVHEDFAKMFRRTLDAAGLQHVLIHGFDNWRTNKWDWTAHLYTDPELRNAIGILGNHTFTQLVEHNGSVPVSAAKISAEMNKPIWDTEEHVYLDGYDCESGLASSFADNFIGSGATKVVNWYLADCLYAGESYKTKPAMLIADQPWSGHFESREALWGYAHWCQFTQVGWQYLNAGCGMLDHGGSCITMKSPEKDYSVILETRAAIYKQKLNFTLTGTDLSTGPLCVWFSNKDKQFVRLDDIKPINGNFQIGVEPKAIYSLSTTTGQQKGSFENIPKSAAFPLPYRETFEQYKNAAAYGYQPHYTADIGGAFELADRADGQGKCFRQVLTTPAQAWGHEWAPFTVLGDSIWKDYQVICDVRLDPGSRAGLLGRVEKTAQFGDAAHPMGLYFQLNDDGNCTLLSTVRTKEDPSPKTLATGKVPPPGTNWHQLKLRMSGTSITGFVDDKQVLQATDTISTHGVAGLCTGPETGGKFSTADFDNLTITAVDAAVPPENAIDPNRQPMYPR